MNGVFLRTFEKSTEPLAYQTQYAISLNFFSVCLKNKYRNAYYDRKTRNFIMLALCRQRINLNLIFINPVAI